MGRALFAGATLLLVFSAGSVSTAQETPAPFRPEWAARPNGRDVERLWPPEGMRTGHPGLALLCCRPMDNGKLDCALAAEWPKDLAASTGRRNTLVKSLSWRFEVQRFSWPLVELAGDAVEMRL